MCRKVDQETEFSNACDYLGRICKEVKVSQHSKQLDERKQPAAAL